MLEPGETSLLKRNNIKGSFYGPGMSTVNASGAVYLTTRRIIFVPKRNSRSNREFWAQQGNMVSIRLGKITKHRFNQPIFGANSISLRILHLNPRECMKCKLSFYSGGVGTFLAAFLRLLRALEHPPTAGGAVVAEAQPMAMHAEVQLATAIRGAPLNPNDPTAIWISDAIIVDEVETDSVPATAATSRQF